MMDSSSGIEVGELRGAATVRVVGKGTHLNSHLLKEYATHVLEKKGSPFQLDLSACSYMDSTFLGMLAGMGVRRCQNQSHPIRVIGISPRVKGMMEGLGIDHLFEMIDGPVPAAALRPMDSRPASPDQKSRDMLEAHETLVAVSSSNEAKFRDVIALLRESAEKSGSS